MQKRRWLLPCTQGIDTQAIQFVVRTAANQNVDLVPVSLLDSASGLQSPGTQLVHNAQAKNFLSCVRKEASRHHVPVECHNVYTQNVPSKLQQLKQRFACDNIVIVLDKQHSVFLPTEQVKRLQKGVARDQSLLFVKLPERGSLARSSGVASSLAALMRRMRKQEDSQKS